MSSPNPASFSPSAEQLAIYDWVENGEGSAYVDAVAGSGKSSTLVAACALMTGSVALAAFNKRIAKEIEGKVAHLRNVNAKTFHAFGLAAWRSFYDGTISIDAREKRRLMLDRNKIPPQYAAAIAKLVSMAKLSVVGVAWNSNDIETWEEMIDHFDIVSDLDSKKGHVPEESTAVRRLIEYAQKAVEWCGGREGQAIIDFDDMMWLPLLLNAPFPKYDWVLVDEAQDTGVGRRMLAERMLVEGGRTLWVGDKFQNIYAFAGADSDAIELIAERFHCALLPLTTTYRCSKAATALAQKFVPHIHAAEANLEGSVKYQGYMEQVTPEPQKGDAILCRNTKPIVELAFAMLRNGVPCYVEGRDIGEGILGLINRWKVERIEDLMVRLESYRQQEVEKALVAGKEYRIAYINDRVETIIALSQGCESVQEVRVKVGGLFQDTQSEGNPNSVVLSTIHKAKGREWSRVIVLGWQELMPSKWAKQDWEMQQEWNLKYVACTRTKDELVLVG